MFDLQDKERTRAISDSPIDRLQPVADNTPPETEDAVHELDSEELVLAHERLLSFYRQELDRQSENRFQMSVDEDYLDNIQWSEEDAEILRERGQAPLVYNVIGTSVRWVVNTERRTRMDFKVLPRRKEEGSAAEKKTSLLKYLSDVNRTPHHRSRAFKDAVAVGIGWLETSVQDEDDGEPIYTRYESWRNMLWDSASTEMDLSDARYLFRARWVDVDVAKAFFPDRGETIDSAAVEGEQFGSFDGTDGDEAMDYAEYHREDYGIARNIVSYKRKRVRLIECWFKKPERRKKVLKGPWRGQPFDESDPRHAEFAESIGERMMFSMHCAVFTTKGLLYYGRSPFRHNRFTFIPVWGYKRGRDGLPYGMVRGLRDIQDDINKRAAKAQYILSTNKVIMDEGAVEDIEAFREEVSRPDAILVKRPGKEIKLDVDRELATAQLELFSRAIQMIQQAGGVTDEAMGRTTNAVSGRAIEARQEQGSVATMDFFDNLRFAEQQRGELELSLVEQFMTEAKQFRITNLRGNADFVSMNDGLPENDITRSKADFVVSEVDYRASVREAQTEQLINLMSKLPPQVAMVFLDLVVEGMDVKNRDEIVKRIRQVTGMRDPDATEPTPEELQAAQAAAEQQQRQRAMEDAALRKANADAARAEAGAVQSIAAAERTRTQAIGDRVSAQTSAIAAAREALMTPAVVPVADGILSEAGWPNPAAMPPAAPAPAGSAQEVVPPAAEAGINQPPM